MNMIHAIEILVIKVYDTCNIDICSQRNENLDYENNEHMIFR